MDAGVLLAALVPAIVVVALAGGMTVRHPRRRMALAGASLASILWVVFLVITRLSSS